MCGMRMIVIVHLCAVEWLLKTAEWKWLNDYRTSELARASTSDFCRQYKKKKLIDGCGDVDDDGGDDGSRLRTMSNQQTKFIHVK